jgi:aerobic-type carbon monoxide dehydrogenase small subunit (CoxS/CutS family)
MTADPQERTIPDGSTAVSVELTVNGTKHLVHTEACCNLATLLRDALGLAGTKIGCEQGMCGTCTVLVDGDPVRACLMLAAQAHGSTVETVESLSADGPLGRLQREFGRAHALQCGFCTPGFLMLSTALLRREPAPDRERIREYLSANLCRCTGYTPIIDAVAAAAGLSSGPSPSPDGEPDAGPDTELDAAAVRKTPQELRCQAAAED